MDIFDFARCLKEEIMGFIAHRTMKKPGSKWFSCGTMTLFFFLSLFGWFAIGFAATYYVDPATGANTNNGTSPNTPWRNPPGTRTANNSGFYSSAWGSITTGNKIKCGDTILLKGGSSQASTQGGAWRIDTNYYTENCPASHRMTIRIANGTEWPGSSSDFTLNGSDVAYAGMDSTPHASALILIETQSVSVLGLSRSKRIIVQGSGGAFSPGRIGVAIHGEANDYVSDVEVGWVVSYNHAGPGFSVGFADGWVIRDGEARSNLGPGIDGGMFSDASGTRIRNGAYVRMDVHDNGQANPPNTGYCDAVYFVGHESAWVIDTQIRDNWCRGANSGEIGSSGSRKLRFRGSRFWNNGRSSADGIVRVNAGFSGDDVPGGNLHQNYITYSTLFGGPHYNTLVYGEGELEVWNSVYHGGGQGDYQINTATPLGTGSVGRYFNNIGQKLTPSVPQHGGWGAPSGCPIISSDNNIWRPAAGVTETFSAFSARINCGWANYPYNSTAVTWIGANDIVAGRGSWTFANTDPMWVRRDDVSGENNDYTLRAGSPAIDRGRFFMVATGSTTHGTTLIVSGNGGSGDPRDFFIAPSSYYGAAGDLIQIQNAACSGGGSQARIVSMTGTSITLDRVCTWANGAGVHLPWSGSAPDIGAYEFTGNDAPPSPPRNFRVLQ